MSRWRRLVRWLCCERLGCHDVQPTTVAQFRRSGNGWCCARCGQQWRTLAEAEGRA